MSKSHSSWTLIKKAGSGFHGEVWQATTPEGRRVAVKQCASIPRQEVEMLLKLKHPSLVGILGYSQDGAEIFGDSKGPSLWTEWIEGRPLLEAARGASTQTMMDWFRQALEVLAYLESQRAVHGDLSPRNILIDENGRLRLIDLGGASIDGNAAISLEAAALHYLAPERIEGLRTPASDLFSLGTIFYEALAGIHPRSQARNLRERLWLKPAPLAEVLPSVTEGYAREADLIDRMIESDAEARFGSAKAALQILNGGHAEARSGAGAFYHHATMLGAEEAQRMAYEALAQARRQSRVLCVHGASGTGKSRFLGEMVIEARLDGWHVEEFGPESFVSATHRWMSGGSRHNPAMLVLRDLDRVSAESLAMLLTWRHRGLPSSGFMLVLEWDDDEVPSSCRNLFLELASWGGIELHPLSLKQTKELLEGALRHPVDAKEVRKIHERTGGVPKVILEAAEWMRSGKISSLSSSSLESFYHLRWESFSDGERDLLRWMAAAVGPVTTDELLQASGLEFEKFNSALQGLLLCKIVLGRNGRLELKSEGLAARILQETPSALVAEFHRRWFEVRPNIRHAVALGQSNFIEDHVLGEVEALSHAGRKEEALRLTESAKPWLKDPLVMSKILRFEINVLNEIGRYEDALSVCENWKTFNAQDEPESLREMKYWFVTGMNHQNLGRHEEAVRRLNRCLQTRCEAPEAKTFLLRAHTLLGVEDACADQIDEAMKHYDSALSMAQGRRRAEILRNKAAVLAGRGGKTDLGESYRLLEESQQLYEADHYREGAYATSLQEGILAAQAGDDRRAGQAYAKAEAVAKELDNPFPLASVWHNQAVLLHRQGRSQQSLELFEHSNRIFRALNLKEDLAESERQWSEARGAAVKSRAPLPKAPSGGNMEPVTQPQPIRTDETVIERILELSHALLKEDNMGRVLKRLMDAALELTGTENGFLLLEDAESVSGPLQGFEVAVARNIRREDLSSENFAISLSAVRDALRSGQPILTDNASADPRYSEAQSVLLSGLKSILALPLSGAKGTIGVFYLDHRFKEGIFGEELLPVLKVFAAVASLALQKGRMIEDLQQANAGLERTIEDQVRDAETMKRELAESRRILKHEYSEIIGKAPQMMEVLSLVDRLTDSKVPVWIFGESGTGKESIARALHYNGPRAKAPFVTENCSALPESLLESELFGHKKGSFTHATADKKGILEYADHGTIFLDEIADMSLNLQAKLLRFLQEGEVRPIGSHQVKKVDVRVVSASNKDLSELVAQGKFREDLFYRLNGVTVTLPSLRERPEDINLLAEHFLKRIAEREKKKPLKLSPETFEIFLKYAWPGNVRELQNTLETAALFAENGEITPKSLKFKTVLSAGGSKPQAPLKSAASAPPKLIETLVAIRDQCFHRGKAAEVLGISRRNLYTRLARYGIASDLETIKLAIAKYLGT